MMQPEQQQRIIGYFIEESQEHLSTIEQGLDDLQQVVQDPEAVHELFRAAHSIKGGAAMLGMGSIQQIAHHLERYFKLLKQPPELPPIPTLASWFWPMLEALQGLVQQLQLPDGLTESSAQAALSTVEVSIAQLEAYFTSSQASHASEAEGTTPLEVPANLASDRAPEHSPDRALVLIFQDNVPAHLETMRSLFQQADRDPLVGEQLQEICRELRGLGEAFCLPQWSHLLETARRAIAAPQPSYTTLNALIPQAIEQAQQWVLSGRSADIAPSPDLLAQVPASVPIETDLAATADDPFSDSAFLADLFPESTLDDLGEMPVPKVGMAQLNQFADLFEGEVPDLGSTWQEEEVLEPTAIDPSMLELDDLLTADVETTELPDWPVPPLATNADPTELQPPETYLESIDFAELEAMLDEIPTPAPPPIGTTNLATAKPATANSAIEDADFDELAKLLGTSPGIVHDISALPSSSTKNRSAKGLRDQTMRVPVKNLDHLNNLVGELVVSRNSLEEDQERMRQSLGNLLSQVQKLSDVGQRMQDLYERSLLENSLFASRRHHGSSAQPLSNRAGSDSGSAASNANGVNPNNTNGSGNGAAANGQPANGSDHPDPEYDPLEMDRFTGFHSLSQEMMELIVRVRESASDIEFVVGDTDSVTRMFRQVTSQLQESLTRSRMIPFGQAADRLPRAVREIANRCGKQAELAIEGRDTLVDKMILEQLYDPLTHLVNNAITHGVELPEQRLAAGKPAQGKILIRAFHQGNQTVISVSDDGAGVDVERVRTKAIAQGLVTAEQAQKMDRLAIYELLFHPGFSTKDQADDFSGRGVGMDVVHTSLAEIRGTIHTDSTPGQGTHFTIRLPLTLSISKALCCVSDRGRIAFPMDGVEEIFNDLPKDQIQTDAEGQQFILWQNTSLPLKPLSQLLFRNRHLGRSTIYGGAQDDDRTAVVVLRSADAYLALQVDQILGEQEIVIKQLEGPVPKPVGVAGATVLGDGRIMPIADVLELIDLSMGRIREVGTMWEPVAAVAADTQGIRTEPMVLIVDDSITVRELLSMTFTKVGYRVEQARDGQEAWDKLRSGLPCDLIFCDIEMPRMDGLQLLKHLQADPQLQQLPIAMLTSRGADRHRQMAASLGARGYFTKPYIEEMLLDAAQRMLEGEQLLIVEDASHSRHS